MRKTLLSALGIIVALSMCATTAFAVASGRGRNFLDTDGDGICDNTSNMCIYADADGDGICDACGRNFIDADGDGVCDNYGTGQGGGYGRSCHGGRGNGFRGGRGR